MQRGSNMRRILLAMIPAAGVILAFAAEAAAQTNPPDFPIGIICYIQQDQSWRVVYLNRVKANGDAIYLSGRLGLTVNAKRVVVTPVNRPDISDCFGKTLDELRSNGRVIDFQRPH